MNKTKCRQIFEIFAHNNPHPTTELNYSSTFELLISVILSAQATDISVNKATDKLFLIANTPEKILHIGEEELIPYIQAIGLYKTKAKNIIKTCQMLIELYNGEVPNNRKALETLPGVGRKTANVVLNTAFGEPTIAVDTHIFRIANRMNLAPGKSVNEVEHKLLYIIPKKFLKDAHHWLILHGRYICTAKKPKCSKCPIYDLCEFKQKEVYL
ncbi:endonuclease III [Fastidiosibacter lacustris]|uniref:endonuclease III n=1 Tax=Fastidiosibacter lacustris TaxID=2056695 RepID=UPI000E355553|nr:endonuclease III [Fastidiosibacter lacustris]